MKKLCKDIHLNKRSPSGQYSNEFYFILELLYNVIKSASVGRRMNNEGTHSAELILL